MNSASHEGDVQNAKINGITMVDENMVSTGACTSAEPTQHAKSAEPGEPVEPHSYARCRTSSDEAKSAQAHITCLKWDYAESELRGIAEAIQALSAKTASSSSSSKSELNLKIGIIAPNYTWATQMQQACKHVDSDATVCVAVPEQARVAQQVFATLTLLVNPADTQASETLLRLGVTSEAQKNLVERYGSAHGLTLVHGLGLDTLAPFAHALRHRTGDENATTLLKLLRRECITPTMHDLHGVIPIMDWASLQETYDWLFLIGCVEGLLPETVFATSAKAATKAATETATEPQRLDTAETAPFADALQRANNVVISHFTKIDEATAQAFGVIHVRSKQEGDRRIALARSCSHIKAVLPALPTTEGGEAFLNRLRTRNGILS